jgi:hypothetical protein
MTFKATTPVRKSPRDELKFRGFSDELFEFVRLHFFDLSSMARAEEPRNPPGYFWQAYEPAVSICLAAPGGRRAPGFIDPSRWPNRRSRNCWGGPLAVTLTG